jgi:acetylornithine deacetylase/succinyl-diaminopimelate desuccinylase-like protein
VSLREEVTELLRELIRVDTVNPPGNETRAAGILERYLARRGVASMAVARRPTAQTLSHE